MILGLLICLGRFQHPLLTAHAPGWTSLRGLFDQTVVAAPRRVRHLGKLRSSRSALLLLNAHV